MKTNTRSLRGLGLASVLALPLLVPSFAFAQAEPYPTPRQGGAADVNRVDRGDRDFFEKSAESGHKEVTVSKAVMPRLANPAVRAYADMMITEHTAANKELSALAEKKGVILPVMDPSERTKEWGGKTENADKDFIEEMIDDHEDAIDRFENATRSKDADVVAFAQKMLPALRRHLQQAESLQKAMR
jgi:putative membrane protein